MVRNRRQRSIWNYLLIGAFIVAAGLSILLIAAAIIVPRVIDRTIERYTDAAPISGETADLRETDYAALRNRVENFADAVDSGTAAEPLVLTSDEVAALIQREVQAELNATEDDPDVQLWLRIEGDRLKGPVSIKTDELAVGLFEGLRDRYLNGVATLDVGHSNGQIHVRLDDFQIDGESIPTWIMDGVRDGINTAVADSRELSKLGRKLESIEIRDGQAVVRPKAP